jgi:hypothetical protein
MIEFCDKENAVVWFKAIPEIERKIRKKAAKIPSRWCHFRKWRIRRLPIAYADLFLIIEM